MVDKVRPAELAVNAVILSRSRLAPRNPMIAELR
jgi:hypothetical protein